MFLSQIVTTNAQIEETNRLEKANKDAEAKETRCEQMKKEETLSIKKRLSLDVRKEWCKKAKMQYPDKVAIIIEPHTSDIQSLKNPKFLMPVTFRINEVLIVLRKKLKMTRNDALVLYVQKGSSSKYLLLAGENAVSNLYARYKDPEDEMLYFIYAKENVFG